jgi:hypothetical protein
LTDMKAKYLKLAREQEQMRSIIETEGATPMRDQDQTEQVRREMIEMDYPQAVSEKTEQHWTTEELSRDFTVQGFMAPFVIVKRKSDGKVGTMMFTHEPRSYFRFEEDK